MFYLCSLDGKVQLNEPLKTDSLVVFQSASLDLKPSQTGNQIDNSALNLLDQQNNVMLHISIRRTENAIVFNSREHNGNWGKEERVTLKDRFVGPNVTVTVYDHGDRYQILIDYRTVYYYNKRIRGDCTTCSYSMNQGQSPVFSNPIAVNTYKTMANMMANGV